MARRTNRKIVNTGVVGNIADTAGLILTAGGYVVGFSGELSRKLGADGIRGSWTAGAEKGAQHADLVYDWVSDALADEAKATKRV